jgi:hypothetical protein
MDKPLSSNEKPTPDEHGTGFATVLRRVLSSRYADRESPLTVLIIRSAAVLSLFAGVIMLIAASVELGVAIILLSALYVALAEIINYLAVIARNSAATQRAFESDPIEDFEHEFAER